MEHSNTQFIYRDLETEALWLLLVSPQLSDNTARQAIHDELCARGIYTEQQKEYMAYYRREQGLATDAPIPLKWYQFKQRLLRDDSENVVAWSFDNNEEILADSLPNSRRLRFLLFLVLLMPLYRIVLEFYNGFMNYYYDEADSLFDFKSVFTIAFYCLLIRGIFKKWKFIWSLSVIHCLYVALLNLTDLIFNYNEILIMETFFDYLYVVSTILYTILNALSFGILVYLPISNLFAVSKTRKTIALAIGLFFYVIFFSLHLYTGRI